MNFGFPSTYNFKAISFLRWTMRRLNNAVCTFALQDLSVLVLGLQGVIYLISVYPELLKAAPRYCRYTFVDITYTRHIYALTVMLVFQAYLHSKIKQVLLQVIRY